MSVQFVGDPAQLNREGSEIVDKAQQFGQNVNKIYSTVQEMITSAYLSPAAKVIAEVILSYKDDLEKMMRTINDYGEYCKTAGNTVFKNDASIQDMANDNRKYTE